MRALKHILALGVLFALARYGLVHYRCFQFNEFVQKETQRGGTPAELTKVFLSQAEKLNLPIDKSNVTYSRDGTVVRVSISYTVPVNLYISEPRFAFKVIAPLLIR